MIDLEEKSKIDCFFYLDLKGRRDANFFKMAKSFAKLGLTLIPVKWDSLMVFIQEEGNVPLVIHTSSLLDTKNFTPRLMQLVRRMIQAQKIDVYHFSSFSDVKLKGFENSKYYRFISLPVHIKNTLAEILAHANELRDNSNRWPGGIKGASMRF